jgi:hypothetical protein
MNFGEIGMRSVATVDTMRAVKTVTFRPSTAADTVRVGDLVCYNSDLAADWKEATSNRLSGDFGGENATTYAEGAQTYNARFLVVEKPADANLEHFAGIVTALGPQGGADGDTLQICPLVAGAVVPVYTDVNCTINQSVLGVSSGSYLAQLSTGDDSPLAIGVAVETVDRSNTNGLVWMRMFGAPGIGRNQVYLAPSNDRNGRCYGVYISGDDFFGGAAGAQEYLVMIQGDKTVASTGDAYGGLMYLQANVDAVNDSNYIFRGLNVSVDLEDSADLGSIYGANLSISLKANTAAIGNAIACQVDAQDLSSGAKDVFGGLDIALNREGTAATEEFALRLRTRGTINTAINAAIRIDKDATDHGFVNLFVIESDGVDYASLSGDKTFDTSDVGIPIVLGSTTYYIIASDSL